MDNIATIEDEVGLKSTSNQFIRANTINMDLREIQEKHVIPVFSKLNEPLISHYDFVQTTLEVLQNSFKTELINDPIIKVSHPIKGRIPEAKHKSSKDLLENEKTLYFERMAFMIEIPTVFDSISNDTLILTVGGIKAFNLDNFNSNRLEQHFKIFIGLKNCICTNLCIKTDGLKSDIVVKSILELKFELEKLIEAYNPTQHLRSLKELLSYEINEQQFSFLIGRLKMYNLLSNQLKKNILDLKLTESQLNTFINLYFNSPDFCKNIDGSINLWKLYNNATEALKSTYIDGFLDKNVNAYDFVHHLSQSLNGIKSQSNWYLE